VTRTIHGVEINGVDVDPETRCLHYHEANDIIALKLKCCDQWFPCHECHVELAGHVARVWSRKEFDELAVLCGGCGHLLTIRKYLECCSVCPQCKRSFNPRCAHHRHLYFETDQ
jgi:uncharacterized CHY-type Zn-finger protein